MACQVGLVLDRCLVFSQALVNLHQLNNGKQLVDVLHQQGDIPGHQSGLQLAVGNLQHADHGRHQQADLHSLMPALSRQH